MTVQLSSRPSAAVAAREPGPMVRRRDRPDWIPGLRRIMSCCAAPGMTTLWIAAYPRPFAPRYNAPMTDLILTPVLAATLAQKPRRRRVDKGGGGGKKSPHNFVAEGEKRKAGAPLANRNAAVRDADRLERRARLAYVQSVVSDTCALARACCAAADEGLSAQVRLSTLLLPGSDT